MPLSDDVSATSDVRRPPVRVRRQAEPSNGEDGAPLVPSAGHPQPSSVQRCETFGQSLRCACRGVGLTVSSQRNLRIQGGIALLVVVGGLLLGLAPLEWAAIALAMAVVFIAEITNTAIEAIVDLISPGYSELARIAKDASAGATLVAAAASVIVGLLILGPHLLRLLSG
ncbi:MAG: diacylglycerol kinase family protein [Anaerolineae bacterium]